MYCMLFWNERWKKRAWKKSTKQQASFYALHVTIPTWNPCSQLCSAIPQHVRVNFHQDQAQQPTLAYIVPHTCQTSEKKTEKMFHMVLIKTEVSYGQCSLLFFSSVINSSCKVHCDSFVKIINGCGKNGFIINKC